MTLFDHFLSWFNMFTLCKWAAKTMRNYFKHMHVKSWWLSTALIEFYNFKFILFSPVIPVIFISGIIAWWVTLWVLRSTNTIRKHFDNKLFLGVGTPMFSSSASEWLKAVLKHSFYYYFTTFHCGFCYGLIIKPFSPMSLSCRLHSKCLAAKSSN